MAGTLPERRRRRLAPLPCVARESAATSKLIRIDSLQLMSEHDGAATSSPSPAKSSIYIERTHRLFVADAADGLRQQRSNRQHANAATGLRRGGQRDGVGHH